MEYIAYIVAGGLLVTLGTVFTLIRFINLKADLIRQQVNTTVIAPMNDNNIRWSQLYQELDTRIRKLEGEDAKWKTDLPN